MNVELLPIPHVLPLSFSRLLERTGLSQILLALHLRADFLGRSFTVISKVN